jgi:hypothetical protein
MASPGGIASRVVALPEMGAGLRDLASRPSESAARSRFSVRSVRRTLRECSLCQRWNRPPLIRDKFAQEQSAKRFINYVLGIVGAMNTRNAVLFLLLTAFMSGLGWSLHSLANTRSLSSFVILCVVTFAIMATAGYAVDHWQDHSEQ